MKRLKYFLVFIFLIFCSKDSFSQLKGCYIAGENNIYTFDTGSTSYLFFAGNYDRYSTPRPTNAPNCPRAQLLTNLGSDCVRPLSSIFDYAGLGTLYTYKILNPPIDCPIDNYVILLMLPIGSLGFHFMRRRSFQQLQVF